ncbi:MAG: membrane dipeptidase, partial [Chloroflexota bacterium]
AEDGEELPVGLLTLMEGAEGVREPAELELWWELGVRIIGPAWCGTRFCGGTMEPGPLTKEGYALLDGMADIGFTLDISHMDEPAVLQSLDHYSGRLIATHANAMALLKGKESNRFLSDRVIEGLFERQAVIGVVLYNSFLHPQWEKGDPRDIVPLNLAVEQIDYYCQLAGDAKHVGIGTDADGGFGLQSVPLGFDRLDHIHELNQKLAIKGYTEQDIRDIYSGNWMRFLQETLP